MKIYYTSGYKYQLERDYLGDTRLCGHACRHKWFELADNGLLLVRSGYAWDGPSGPTWDDGTNMRGSLEHDALYQAMRLRLLPGHLRKTVDRLFYARLLQDGMRPLRAKAYYVAVREFGGPAASPANARRLQSAGR